MMPTTSPPIPSSHLLRNVKIISSSRRWWALKLTELIEYREVLMVFAWRSITARYRQMALGMVWVVLEPLALLAMMAFLFGIVLRVPTGGYPYPIYAFAALVPWLLFGRGLTSCAESLIANMAIISKIYFPRLILPLSALAKDLFDTGVTVLVLLVVAAIYGFYPGWKTLVLLPALMGSAVTALALGLWVSAVAVRFRDLRYVVTISLQLWMYATPIMYPASLVPEQLLTAYRLNPMYWTTEVSRWALLDQPLVLTGEFWISISLVIAALISGLLVFAAFERLSVDVQ